MHQHAPDNRQRGDTRLTIAVVVNMLLTLVQLVAGFLSGSLALVADALHNFSDAGSILLALIARKIGRRPPDANRTFGYMRAETIATFANTVTLVVIALYLIYEAVIRSFSPEPIEGWIVVVAASFALVIDAGTALLTWSMSRNNMNIRAVFVHNFADMLGSLGVVIAGTLILLFDLMLADTIATFLIAGYMLWESVGLLKSSGQILMDGVPDGVSLDEVAGAIASIEGVDEVHHLRIRSLDEHKRALECHITSAVESRNKIHEIREQIGTMLESQFSITFATIEFELPGLCSEQDADSDTLQ